MNFKGIQTSWKKSDKFTKNLSQLVLHKSEFIWVHLYVRIQVTKTSAKKGLVSIKEKSLNLKFKPYNIYNTNQTCKDLIQDSKIHSELLFKQCSYYSDTRGVTSLPLTEISIRDLKGVATLTGTANNCTFSHYGKTKSRWRE
jgi:hypothetical protein